MVLLFSQKLALQEHRKTEEEWSDFCDQAETLIQFSGPKFVCTSAGGVSDDKNSLYDLISYERDTFESTKNVGKRFVSANQFTIEGMLKEVQAFYNKFIICSQIPIFAFIFQHCLRFQDESRFEKQINQLIKCVERFVDIPIGQSKSPLDLLSSVMKDHFYKLHPDECNCGLLEIRMTDFNVSVWDGLDPACEELPLLMAHENIDVKTTVKQVPSSTTNPIELRIGGMDEFTKEPSLGV